MPWLCAFQTFSHHPAVQNSDEGSEASADQVRQFCSATKSKEDSREVAKAAFICSKALRESVKVRSEMQVITSFTSLRFVVPALLKDKTCHPFTYAWDETEL